MTGHEDTLADIRRERRRRLAIQLAAVEEDIVSSTAVKALHPHIYHRLVQELKNCRMALILRDSPWGTIAHVERPGVFAVVPGNGTGVVDTRETPGRKPRTLYGTACDTANSNSEKPSE